MGTALAVPIFIKSKTMTVNTKKPVLQKLDDAELNEINGGSSANMTMSSGTGSLLSMEFQWQDGNRSKDYKISAGNDISLDLTAYGSGAKMS